MLLQPKDATDFLRDYKELLTLISGAMPNGIEEWVDARDTMLTRWRDFQAREELNANPLYRVLPYVVHGRFCFLKRYKKFCAMRHLDSGDFFAVHSLTTPLEKMLPEYCIIKACLFSFRGIIVCDGLVRSENMLIGKNMAKEIRDDFGAAKRKRTLIHGIDVPAEAGSDPDDMVGPLRTPLPTDYELSAERLRQLRLLPADELAAFINQMAEGNEIIAQHTELLLKRGDSQQLATKLLEAASTKIGTKVPKSPF